MWTSLNRVSARPEGWAHVHALPKCPTCAGHWSKHNAKQRAECLSPWRYRMATTIVTYPDDAEMWVRRFRHAPGGLYLTPYRATYETRSAGRLVMCFPTADFLSWEWRLDELVDGAIPRWWFDAQAIQNSML